MGTKVQRIRDRADQEFTLEQFLEYIFENFTPFKRGEWMSVHSADEVYTHEQIIQLFLEQL